MTTEGAFEYRFYCDVRVSSSALFEKVTQTKQDSNVDGQ
jgi:hypothetical protein